ncbi:hypothetical protein DID88_005076 [Monilinia fructigena]|uniref:Acid phosphatase n=1 Tax=Monilinia fructigena TaxID=38457 RepID=A0A395IQW1_9HELO|nr:hypothetical protein DID88_005076 [Monilinia fructigena]
MLAKQALFISALLPLIQGQDTSSETILGVYIFHRHGDRTAKSHAPTILTDLGYAQRHRAPISENSAWLQGSSGCGNAVTSSNNYFYSEEYMKLLNSTKGFYQSILPVINTTFDATQTTFKNAYTIYDYVHVSTIHNSTPSDDLLTNETLSQLLELANIHEFNLAYNVSDPIRAIAGSTLAAQILEQLNTTITTHSTIPLTLQFGAYASSSRSASGPSPPSPLVRFN